MATTLALAGPLPSTALQLAAVPSTAVGSWPFTTLLSMSALSASAGLQADGHPPRLHRQLHRLRQPARGHWPRSTGGCALRACRPVTLSPPSVDERPLKDTRQPVATRALLTAIRHRCRLLRTRALFPVIRHRVCSLWTRALLPVVRHRGRRPTPRALLPAICHRGIRLCTRAMFPVNRHQGRL
jgi:hypothetical protein